MKKSEFSGIESKLDSLVERGLYFIASNVSHLNADDGSEFHLRIYQASTKLHSSIEAQEEDEALINELMDMPFEAPKDDKNWFEVDVAKKEKYVAGYREFHNSDGRYLKISLSDYGIYVSYFLSAM